MVATNPTSTLTVNDATWEFNLIKEAVYHVPTGTPTFVSIKIDRFVCTNPETFPDHTPKEVLEGYQVSVLNTRYAPVNLLPDTVDKYTFTTFAKARAFANDFCVNLTAKGWKRKL